MQAAELLIGDVVELAHGASSAATFRSAVLATLRRAFGFDTAIFFTTGDAARDGPPGGYNKAPEARALFQHYRDNYRRLLPDLAKGRAASCARAHSSTPKSTRATSASISGSSTKSRARRGSRAAELAAWVARCEGPDD